MTDYGYDAAYFQPAELTASGCVVVFIYTDGGHAYTAAEVASIHGVKPIVFNHENAVTELAGGYAAGVLAASHAMAAVEAFGAPADGSVAIFYSVDVNVAMVGFAPYRAAFDGINDAHAGLFKVGVYGEGALIDDLASSGRIQAKGWLSASSSFPGYNPADGNIGAYQQVGSDIPSTDRDVITNLPGLAPWWPLGVSPAGGGTPIGDISMADAQSLSDLIEAGFNDIKLRIDGTLQPNQDMFTKSGLMPLALRTLPSIENTAWAVAHLAPANTQDPAVIIAAINALPAEVVAAIKEAL